MSSRAQKKGKCIFCSGFGLTKQHVLPDWLKEVLPRDNDSSTQMLTGYQFIQRNTLLVKPEIKEKQGHLGTVKIRNVCQSCNSGWMSRLEKKAKPLLTEMILGKRIVFDKDQIRILVKWIIMTNIMIEYTDITTQAIPETDRNDLYNDKIPECGWKIWLGYYKGEKWKFRFRHHGNIIAHRDKQEEYSMGKYNIQFTTLVLGNLFIHTMRSSIKDYMPSFSDVISNELIALWPNESESIKWPPQKTIDDYEANILSDLFFYKLMDNTLK